MVSIDVLTAVHHPVRRRIIDRLVLEGPSQVGTLARAFGEQVGSISHHLRMLERAGVVERAPELATDGRASWWRYTTASLTWSADDFAERPADLHRAKVAEKLNLEHQLGKLIEWKRGEGAFSTDWRRAAYSSDLVARATPAELADLAVRIRDTVVQWRAEIDPDDGEDREPVFVFAHGFPSRP